MRSLLLAVLIALVPGSASAATVSVRVIGGGPSEGGVKEQIHGGAVVEFVGSPGESNDVEISGRDGPHRFRDVVPIQAGEGCRQVDEHTAECSGGYVRTFLGDGDDRARCAQRLCIVHGGPGDDVIEVVPDAILEAQGGQGDDVVRGGDRPDQLLGGPGADVLEGGAGGDHMVGDDADAPFSPDRMAGGGGRGDVVSYEGRHEPVKVDITAGGGGPGEGDVILEVEALFGGLGDDELTGGEGPDWLSGGDAGDDRLTGRGGDDQLRGYAGRDVLDGGAGDDLLQGYQGPDRYRGGPGDDRLVVAEYALHNRRYAQAELDCGTGRDRVTGPSTHDVVPIGCESARLAGTVLTRLPGRLAFRAQPVTRWLSGCRALLEARSGRRVLAVPFRLGHGATLRFPGFRAALVTLRVRPCRGDRAMRLGGFRAPPR